MLSLWLLHQSEEDLNDFIFQQDEALPNCHMAVGTTRTQIVISDGLDVQKPMTCGSDDRTDRQTIPLVMGTHEVHG
jgi:hypothetical protein